MNSVSGRVFVRETGTGLAGLLVTALRLDRREEGDAPEPTPRRPGSVDVLVGTSLGSDISDHDGNFRIEYEARRDEVRSKDAHAGVRIVVRAPEVAGETTKRVLHVTESARVAGGSEKFAIAIPLETVQEARLTPIKPPLSSDHLLGPAIRNRITNRTTIAREGEAKIHEIAGHSLDATRKSLEAKKETVRAYVRDKALKPFRLPDGGLVPNYVDEGESVTDVTRRVIDRGLASRVNTARISGLLDLSTQELANVLDQNGDVRTDLTNDDIERLIFGATPAAVAGPVVHHNVIEAMCRPQTMPFDKCAVSTEDDTESNNDTTDGEEPAPKPATVNDLKRSLSMVLETVSKNSLSPQTSTQPRPEASDIRTQVHGLELRSGPADAPAFFDFESLHIAFDHVWKQTFDPWWIHDLSDLLVRLEKMGGKPESLIDARTDLLDATRIEVRRVVKAHAEVGRAVPAKPGVRYMSFPVVGDAIDTVTDAAGGLVGDLVNEVGDLLGGGGGPSGGDGNGGGSGWFGSWPDIDFPSDFIPPNRHRFLDDFLNALDELKKRDYEFTAFGAEGGERAVNFGVLVTYRQRWEPISYQAGELVKTIPLAPGETRRFKVRRLQKRSYAEKRSEASESRYNSETQDTLRDIGKIVRDAKFATSFSLSKEVGGDVPAVGGAKTTTKFETNYERASSDTKETFREAIRKATEEFKNNTSVEVTTTEEEELELEESGEITNRNEEIAMTCLFYDLQRRYRVSERIHKVVPVVLVAQEIPRPSDIDERWLIAHDWILRRVIQDQELLEPLEYVRSADHLADKTAVEALEDTLNEQQRLVSSLRIQLTELESETGLPEPRTGLQRYLVWLYDRKYPNWREDEQRIREVYGDEVADQIAERQKQQEELEQQLARETTSLRRATEDFYKAFREYARKMVQVHRLCLEIKSNIMYYMQAIWDHEVPDQRFMRLMNTSVPVVTGNQSYSLSTSDRPISAPMWTRPLEYTVSSNFTLTSAVQRLSDVADLGNLLGYFGNYMVFPLNESNPVTTFMMTPFIDKRAGVRDPDDFGNYTLDDLDRLVCCLQKEMSPRNFEKLKPAIEEAYRARLSNPRPDVEERIVPMKGSMFIEILPGSYPVLEDFKLQHRAVDVQKAVAETIEQQLENLRLTGRLITEEFGDPDTEKVIIRDGSNVVIDT